MRLPGPGLFATGLNMPVEHVCSYKTSAEPAVQMVVNSYSRCVATPWMKRVEFKGEVEGKGEGREGIDASRILLEYTSDNCIAAR